MEDLRALNWRRRIDVQVCASVCEFPFLTFFLQKTQNCPHHPFPKKRRKIIGKNTGQRFRLSLRSPSPLHTATHTHTHTRTRPQLHPRNLHAPSRLSTSRDRLRCSSSYPWPQLPRRRPSSLCQRQPHPAWPRPRPQAWALAWAPAWAPACS